jgi:hypothetical protein
MGRRRRVLVPSHNIVPVLARPAMPQPEPKRAVKLVAKIARSDRPQTAQPQDWKAVLLQQIRDRLQGRRP